MSLPVRSSRRVLSSPHSWRSSLQCRLGHGLASVLLWFRALPPYLEVESRAFRGPRLYPDCSAVAFNDSFTNGKANASALVGVGAVKTFEEPENLAGVFRCDPDSVIG